MGSDKRWGLSGLAVVAVWVTVGAAGVAEARQESPVSTFYAEFDRGNVRSVVVLDDRLEGEFKQQVSVAGVGGVTAWRTELPPESTRGWYFTH